jgi:BirA family biotin operon repressor/biotin-[acetyl-CoA-carboxylase] ligase
MRNTPDRGILEYLSALRSAGPTGYVSGQFLAKRAGISRSAVWKQVIRLRSYGYGITSVRGQGYKLVSETEFPVPWELKARLRTSVIGRTIIYLKTTNSTQSTAISIAGTEPDPNGTVVIAELQKGGRGRLNRKWVSPLGGLWFSVVLKPKIPTASITLLPFVTALAVRDAIAVSTGLEARLKWPNDVMISGRKVAGILLDISAEADSVNYAVIGVGINVNVDAADISARISGSQEITSIKNELGHDANRLKIIQVALERLEAHLQDLYKKGSSEIIATWKKQAGMLGRHVSIIQDGKTLCEGVASDVDIDGSLVIATGSGDKIRIASGDVRVRY